MNRRKIILMVIALAMIAGTAAVLAVVPQKLGRPGVKAAEVPGNTRMDLYLPDQVLGFTSTDQGLDEKSLEMLPKDTSFVGKQYYKPGAIPLVGSVVLMGTDRTSIHKAEYCLQGQGLHIDQITTDTVRINEPHPYDLPVIKIVGTVAQSVDDKTVTKKCVYVYWYVADGALSNDRSGMERMWSMTRKLLFSGVLQRWAYVRFYGICDPAQEDAAYEEIKQMIATAVPQFQLTTGSASAAVAAKE